MRAGSRPRRVLMSGTLALTVLLGGAGTAVAVPPPPPNPSDSEINSTQSEANARAGEVGQLANQLAEAEARLSQLQADVQLKMEQANKARVDLELAQDAAGQARRDAEAARIESDAAAAAIETARAKVDRFIAGSYQQGSRLGSLPAYFGADNPKDLLSRAQLLESVSRTELNALDAMHQAQADKSNKDAAARKAVDDAQRKEAEAEQARGTAAAAQQTAVQAQAGQAAQAGQLQAEKAGVEQRLYDAQSRVSGLQGQRQRYEDWQAQKQAEDEERARQAALSAAQAAAPAQPAAPAPPRGAPAVNRGPAPAGASVEAVIARAMSQLGMPYAWGGGNASGPTYGIRDGGVADSYGDYAKVGFDCSGLMMYAFAGVRALPHYSGYQYNSGFKVPLSQMRRGDMLFWGPGGGQHVALYLGGGQMVEAPQSGSVVKVSPVRYGGIMPYAVRLIG